MTIAGESVDITPGVSILGVLSHLNYEPWYALAEYVDNAIQSWRTEGAALRDIDPTYHLAVDIEIDTSGDGMIVIEDNAGGIRRDDFARAFRAADVPPDRSGLSEFGMGMKSASIWFAKTWSVETTSVGDPNIYTVKFDMTDVLESGASQLRVLAVQGDLDSHFTRVTLRDLNQTPRGRTLGKIRDHMRDIYRSFLRSGDLRLVVAGERMSFNEPTVLIASDARLDPASVPPPPQLVWKKELSIDLNDGVFVTGFAALRDEGSTREAGFALLRRGRVIVGSGDTPYRPAAIYGRGNSYRSQRLFGELNIEGLSVSHTKDGFQWGDREEEMLELLRAELDREPLPLLRQAENYRSRAVTRQQARLIVEAVDSTARSIEQHLPEALLSVDGTEAVLSSVDDQESEAPSFSRVVEFDFANQTWLVTVTSVQNTASRKWLVSSVDKATPGLVQVAVSLNASHPFIRQFALGDRDSYEAVLRIAVAMVVAESLTRDAGLEFAGTMMRNIDSVLSNALSVKLGR